MEEYQVRQDETDVLDDEGVIWQLRGQWEALGRHAESLAEPIRAITVEPQQLIERGVSIFKHHRKAAIALGAAGLSSIGFAAGAVVFSRHAHA